MNILIVNQSIVDLGASFFTVLTAVAEVEGTRMSRDIIQAGAVITWQVLYVTWQALWHVHLSYVAFKTPALVLSEYINLHYFSHDTGTLRCSHLSYVVQNQRKSYRLIVILSGIYYTLIMYTLSVKKDLGRWPPLVMGVGCGEGSGASLAYLCGTINDLGTWTFSLFFRYKIYSWNIFSCFSISHFCKDICAVKIIRPPSAKESFLRRYLWLRVYNSARL